MGTAGLGIVLCRESASAGRLVSLGLIVAGILGLHGRYASILIPLRRERADT